MNVHPEGGRYGFALLFFGETPSCRSPRGAHSLPVAPVGFPIAYLDQVSLFDFDRDDTMISSESWLADF